LIIILGVFVVPWFLKFVRGAALEYRYTLES
jgi:ABC-type dipeptide/oligopeptide/nickel transport system permease subunit